jgi:alpha-aminoadipic semialdehyde synthase
MPGSKKNIIALRREDLNRKGEKRAAISPDVAAKLTASGAKLWVQPRRHPEARKIKRIFTDAAYKQVGAVVRENIQPADVIIGLKEINLEGIYPGKTYAFFSHTHKGQKKNRKMLRALVQGKCSLIDYELITNKDGARTLTAFTYHAGYAGMTDTLWVLGQRLRREGIPNPFEPIRQSQELQELAAIRGVIKGVGKDIERNGTPRELPPIINCILGEGKTSTGAQHIYSHLPVEHITLAQLPQVFANGSRHKVYQLLLGIPEIFRLKPDVGNLHSVYRVWPREEQVELYLSQPELFESNLDQVLPYVTLITNCILWSPRYPRTLTRALMEAQYAHHSPLRVIGDITCDPEGSIEFSKDTWIDDPVFIYHPARKTSEMGMDGDGVAVMAVTNLPCELSADSSDQFARELSPLLDALVNARLDVSLEEAGLPESIMRATILWRGEFTPRFSYMEEFVQPEAPAEALFPVSGTHME